MMGAMDRDRAVDLMVRLDRRFADAKDDLNALDAAIGDGDHGTTIQRGMAAALHAVQAADCATAGAAFKVAGDGFQRASGGAGGLLFAQIFKSIGQAAADGDVTPADLAKGLAGAETMIARFGRAQRGDKTMLDALGPAADALASGGDLAQAAAAAQAGAAETRDMAATQGRARFIADGGRGHIDPGAQSVALIIETLTAV